MTDSEVYIPKYILIYKQEKGALILFDAISSIFLIVAVYNNAI